MRVAALALVFAGGLALSACAGPRLQTAELPCAGVYQTTECIEARRKFELGLMPRPHEMTARERADLSNRRLQGELEYARSRAGETPR